MDRTRELRCAVLAGVLAFAPAAHADDNQLDITVRWSDGRSNTYTQMIRDDDGRDIAARPDTVGGKYLEAARKKLAERLGYTAAVYGPDYWKIPQVSKWFFELKDPSANRVIASNRP